MALRQCKECSNPISTSASACPKSGAKVKRTSTRRKSIVGLVVIGVLGLTLAKSSYTPPASSQPVAAANAVARAAAATGGLSAEQIKSQPVTKSAKLGRDQVPPKPKNAVAPRAKASAVKEDVGTKELLWVEKGKDAVRERLKDPTSAQFKNVFFSRGLDDIPCTCGQVNSKNGLGGYGGYQRFISGGSPELTYLEDEVQDFDVAWKRMCTHSAR